MISGVERADVLAEAAEDVRKAVEYVRSFRGLDNVLETAGRINTVLDDLCAVADRLEKLRALEVVSAKSPPKYKAGDVVMTKACGPEMVVLNVHESTDEGRPVMYECFFQDYGHALSVQLPEYALRAEAEYYAEISAAMMAVNKP